VSREFVTGLRSWVLLLSRRLEGLNCCLMRQNRYFNRIWRRFAFGISRTNIQRTLKTPFHLSEAQTVLLRV
jgi:hypothetical protein